MTKYIQILCIGLCLSVITYASAQANVCFLPMGCDDSDKSGLTTGRSVDIQLTNTDDLYVIVNGDAVSPKKCAVC